jgi:two-component sensor histidine kinase
MSGQLPPPAMMLSELSSGCFDHSPLPMVTVEGATHIVHYVNPAFCRLTNRTSDELVGTSFCAMLSETDECMAQLDRIYRTGQPESYTKLSASDTNPVLTCYAMWPVMANGRAVGVVIQVVETAPLHERTLAMNEALMLGSLRLHEVTAAVASLNTQLQAEISEREQRERDAVILANEIAHRIKNNLQIIIGLIGHEAKSAAAPCIPGYRAMQARIGAIAELYDLISQTSRGETIAVDAYLREIAGAMSTSLLGSTSAIKIEVKAEALDIDPDRTVPFGLLVNELGTNAIKHAFPGGAGRVLLSVERIGDQIELTVADNGVGIKSKDAAALPQKHGSDYVAIFVRQLGGTIAVSASEGTGTTVRVRLPLLAAHRREPRAQVPAPQPDL